MPYIEHLGLTWFDKTCTLLCFNVILWMYHHEIQCHEKSPVVGEYNFSYLFQTNLTATLSSLGCKYSPRNHSLIGS